MSTSVMLVNGFPNRVSLHLLYALFLFFTSARGYEFDYDKDEMAPVILVPGFAGSRIEGRWDTEGHPEFCTGTSDWDLLWINLMNLTSNKALKCWVYRFRLIYDKQTGRNRNQDGVETRVVGQFGSVEPIEYLTGGWLSQLGSGYLGGVVRSFKKSGYSTNASLKAAAYDYRYAPPQHAEQGYFDELTTLVENMATSTQRKVALVAHSMGGLMTSYFLMNKPKKWKDKYIHSFIAISTPWLGTPLAVHGSIIGTSFGIPNLKKSSLKELLRTFPSTAFLLPEEEAYKDTVLVDWPQGNKKYTAKDYKQLFEDIGNEDSYLMWKDFRFLKPIAAEKLGVPLFCVWSSSVKTRFKVTVGGDIENPSWEKFEEIDGDGKISIESLRHCKTFPNTMVKEFPGINHRGILYSDDVINYMKTALSKSVPHGITELESNPPSRPLDRLRSLLGKSAAPVCAETENYTWSWIVECIKAVLVNPVLSTDSAKAIVERIKSILAYAVPRDQVEESKYSKAVVDGIKSVLEKTTPRGEESYARVVHRIRSVITKPVLQDYLDDWLGSSSGFDSSRSVETEPVWQDLPQNKDDSLPQGVSRESLSKGSMSTGSTVRQSESRSRSSKERKSKARSKNPSSSSGTQLDRARLEAKLVKARTANSLSRRKTKVKDLLSGCFASPCF